MPAIIIIACFYKPTPTKKKKKTTHLQTPDMRLSFALTLLAGALGLASPIEDASDAHPPLNRATTNCQCIKGVDPGEYCGYCKVNGTWVITKNRQDNDLYHCHDNGWCYRRGACPGNNHCNFTDYVFV
ncbi:hypothetical protein VTJ83DRAFT_6927 [Remersonia thermophila]|uniref:Uncharacterized protein n=1 Tax=Remersonia thermophila TaxID=72144 RepID=A0ABR4D6C1_9PEZI